MGATEQLIAAGTWRANSLQSAVRVEVELR